MEAAGENVKEGGKTYGGLPPFAGFFLSFSLFVFPFSFLHLAVHVKCTVCDFFEIVLPGGAAALF